MRIMAVAMDLGAGRYTDLPFPPYRYVPATKTPHPTADPKGHSYRPPGSPPITVPLKTPAQWRESEAYLYGCDLYNHSYWWEAHEAWEELWQLTDKSGAQRKFLQGLIQNAACALKLHVGRVNGVRRLLGRSDAYLCGVLEQISGDHFMGLDVRQWRQSIGQYYQTRLAEPGAAPAHDPRTYPYLRLDIQ